MPSIAWLSTAPVKGLALVDVDEIDLTPDGVADECDAHEEDTWCGRHVRVGDAVVRLLEPVARCAITTRNPDTGERDFDTLREIAAYRGLRDGTAIDFGVYGDVVEPGRVRVDDAVVLG